MKRNICNCVIIESGWFLFLGRRCVWSCPSTHTYWYPGTVEKVFLFHVKKKLWRCGRREKARHKSKTEVGWWVAQWATWRLDFSINRNLCFTSGPVGNLVPYPPISLLTLTYFLHFNFFWCTNYKIKHKFLKKVLPFSSLFFSCV